MQTQALVHSLYYFSLLSFYFQTVWVLLMLSHKSNKVGVEFCLSIIAVFLGPVSEE